MQFEWNEEKLQATINSNKKALRRALDLLDLNVGTVQNLMYQNPTTLGLRELENLPSIKQMLKKIEIQRILTTVSEAHTSLDAYTKLQHSAEVSGSISQIHNALSKAEAIGAIQHIDRDMKRLATSVHHAIVPLAEQINSFSIAAAQAVPSLRSFKQKETWQTSIADRMALLQTPWAIKDHIGVSMVGFARIARLYDISSGPTPFHPSSGEIFDDELGAPSAFDEAQTDAQRDEARIDAGLNPEVVAFPEVVYPTVLFSAGFDLRIPAIAPVKTENGDETARFDPQHANLLSQVENRLRALIEAELQRIEGDRWLRSRVHGETRKKWQERKTKDHDQRRDSYPLLYYADFRELEHIICEGKNWTEAFHRFFLSKPDFQISMQRLAPIRNAIAHNRPLVLADQITLVADAFRILNALGISM